MKIKAIKAEVIERIKREWQEHNRDYGLTWNEVATLVNQVSRHHTQTSRPSVEEANKIVEENFKGLNDLIEDADFLQFYKSLISDCMVDFAKHHAPTDQCENEPDWNCPKCGFIYTSKVTSDGHCKNCSEQVTQRSHTPTDQSNTSFSKQWTEEEIEELNLSSRKGHTPTEKDECQFEADTDRTSATICKLCGKEKHEHSHASKLCPDRFSHFKPTEKEQPMSAEEWLKCHPVKLIYNEDIQESTIRLIDVAPLLEQYKLIK